MTMREKIARAMLDRMRTNNFGGHTGADRNLHEVVFDGDFDMLSVADAALDALMEPTEGMTLAAIRVDRNCLGLNNAAGARLLGKCMAAMIAAAKEGK